MGVPYYTRIDLDLRGPLSFVAIDRLAPVAARSGVVDGTGELDARRTGHGESLEGLKGIEGPAPLSSFLPLAYPSSTATAYFAIFCRISANLGLGSRTS